MKNIEKLRKKLEEEAIKYLRNTLYFENSSDCPDPFYVSIMVRDKEQDEEIYKTDLKIFKTLFNAGNENYKIALWNRLTCYYRENEKFCRQDFSHEETVFIKEALKSTSRGYAPNVNPPIKTNRLVLRAFEKSDIKLFVFHYKYEGDFFAFTGYKPTSKLIKQYADRCLPTFFAIEEQNEHRVIGYIGLSIREHEATGLLEYYIFKEYRNKGYCKEAICALIEKALNNKLYEPIDTVRNFVYDKKAIKLNAIRAIISVANIPSLNTVKSCGFIHEATLHKTMLQPDLSWTDGEIYYITKEIYEKFI